jgi:hypothetical protein
MGNFGRDRAAMKLVALDLFKENGMEANTFETGPRPLTAKLVALLKAEAASDQARLDLPGWRYRGLAAFVLVEGKPFYPRRSGRRPAQARPFGRGRALAGARAFQHGSPF